MRWNTDFSITKRDSVVRQGAILVKNTSAGNGVLGAIDYLVNYRKYYITMVTEERFEEERKDVHKQ